MQMGNRFVSDLDAKFNLLLVSPGAKWNISDLLLTAFNAVLGAGGSLSVGKEARYGEDLLPTVLHCFQGAAGRASRGDLRTAKVVFFPFRVRVPQVGRSLGVQAAFEALGRGESRLVPARCPVPILRRGGERPEGTNAAVIQHADRRAVQVGWGKLVMEVQEGWRKVPVGESRWHRTLTVIHGRKSVRTIVEGQVDVFLNRHWDAEGARLLAGN